MGLGPRCSLSAAVMGQGWPIRANGQWCDTGTTQSETLTVHTRPAGPLGRRIAFLSCKTTSAGENHGPAGAGIDLGVAGGLGLKGEESRTVLGMLLGLLDRGPPDVHTQTFLEGSRSLPRLCFTP